MKKEYTKPEVDFIEFDNEIVITSGVTVDDGTVISKEDCGGQVFGGLVF